jgi:hypothetical protein
MRFAFFHYSLMIKVMKRLPEKQRSTPLFFKTSFKWHLSSTSSLFRKQLRTRKNEIFLSFTQNEVWMRFKIFNDSGLSQTSFFVKTPIFTKALMTRPQSFACGRSPIRIIFSLSFSLSSPIVPKFTDSWGKKVSYDISNRKKVRVAFFDPIGSAHGSQRNKRDFR